MLLLNQNQKIQFKITGSVIANEIPAIVVSESEKAKGMYAVESSGTTLVTICDGSDSAKSISSIIINNTDTGSHRAYVYFVDSNNILYQLANPLLSAGDQLTYGENGWVVTNSNGGIKNADSNGANVPMVTKVSKTFQSFSAAALTNDIEIYSLAPGERLVGVTQYISTNFTGGAIASYTISVGINGNLTKYAAAFNAFSGAGNFQDTSNFYLESWSASTSVRGAAVSTGANLSAATAGLVEFYIETIQVKS